MVVWMLLCPRISMTVPGGTPCASSSEQQACRRSWKRRGFNPARTSTLKRPGDVLRKLRAAVRGAEDQSRLVPALALLHGLALPRLAVAVGLERCHGHGSEGHSAALLGLGLDKAPLAIDALQRLPDEERALLQVNVIPLQAEGLAEAQPDRQPN